MNKIATVLLICLPFTTVTAQQQQYKGFRFGLQGNVGINKFVGTDIVIYGEMVPKTRLLFGGDLDIGYRFNKHIALYTGIGMQQADFSVKLKPLPDFRYREWYEVYGYTIYWELPLRFRYNVALSNIVDLYFDAGVKGGLLQSYRVNFYIDDPHVKNKRTTVKDHFPIEKWPISPLAGVGANFSLGPKFELNIGAELAYQVNNTFDGEVLIPFEAQIVVAPYGWIEHWEAYPFSGMIKAGFHYKLNRKAARVTPVQ